MSTAPAWPHAASLPGRLTVIQSAGGRVPALPEEVRALRIDAATLHGGLSVLAQTEHELHEHDLLERIPWPGIRAGLRRRLLGEEPVVPRGPRVLAGLEQLATAESRPVVWVIERAHRADADSRGWLGRQVRHMGAWPVAVVVGVAPDDPWGAGLAAQAEHCFGPEAVLRMSDSATVVHAHPPDPLPTEPEELAELAPGTRVAGPEAMAVLRAGAFLGRSFELPLLAALVGLPRHRVATLLQEGMEAGWELEQAGAVLRFGRGATELLRQGIAPAVAAAWAERLAELRAEAHSSAGASDEDGPEEEPSTEEEAIPPEPPRDPRPGPGPQPLPAEAVAEATLGPRVRRLLDLAAAARAEGAWNAAAAHLASVESLLPASQLGSRLGRELRLERARLAWQATGTGIDLDTAQRWAESLVDDAALAGDIEMVHAARILAATIAYDVGDPAALDQALDHLSAVTRALQEAGEARRAAALLNDQAAVWVRIGDPVRAAHLLQASREVFAAAETPEDRAELGETLLLLARLVLHVDARPGKQQAAREQALDHARHVALCRATEGRLLLLLGKTDAALHALAEAMETQRALHDVLGLARTADGLAQVMLAQGRHDDAVRFLADSLRFNAASGARRGLAYNRETAGRIRADLDESSELATMLDGWIDQLG